MNKFKKVLMSVMATIMATTGVASLAGCGKSGVDYNDDYNVVAYDGSKVTVTFYHTMGQKLKDILDAYIKEFNELYPNITVEHSSPTNDYDVLRKNISDGLSNSKAPSMAFCYPDHVALYNTFKAVVPLDGLVESDLEFTNGKGEKTTMGFTDEEVNSFYEAFYNEGKSYGDGKMYTLPYLKSTEVLYYNKTYFDENNLQPPKTWDEMWTLCAQIKEISNNDSKVVPLGYDSEANWFITMTEQRKTPYTSFDSPKFLFNTEENRAFVAELKEYYNKGYFTTRALNGNTYTSKLFNEGSKKDTLRCYMCIGSTGGSSYQAPTPVGGKDPFEVGVAMIPQETTNTADYKVLQQGPSICLFKQSNPQEVAASWLLAKFLTTSIGYQVESSLANGYTPVIKTALQNEYFAEQLEAAKHSTLNADLQAKTVVQALAQADWYYTSLAFDGSSSAREYVGLIMQACLNNAPANGQSMADFIKGEFDKRTNYLINKYN